jgi:hypothetical protein
MRAHIACVTMFLLLVAVGAAFPQAAAEAILLNGSSATAVAKAGTVLGNTLNRTNSRISGDVQTLPQSKVITHTKKPALQAQRHLHAPATITTNEASMITSIQGGRVTYSSATLTPRSTK